MGLPKIFYSQDIQFKKKNWSSFFDMIPFNSLKKLPRKENFGLIIHSSFIINSTTIDNKTISFVASLTSGFDHIDREYLEKIKIPFFYAPGHNAIPVAEYVIESICLYFSENGINLETANIVIFGGGNIGSIVFEILKKLNVKNIVIIDPYLYPDVIYKKDLLENFRFYLENTNVITFHTPLTYENLYPTYRLLGNNLLSQCKNRPLIINTSRGKIAQEKDLLLSLQTSKISQLILDVWENEKNPTKNTLNLVKDIFIATPHLSGKSNLSLNRGEEKIQEQIFSLYGIYQTENKKNNSKYILPNKITFPVIVEKSKYLKEITSKFNILCKSCANTEFLKEFKKIRTLYGNLRKEWSEI